MTTKKKLPKLCHHKRRNLGFVILNRRFHYLDLWKDPATVGHYHRLIAEWGGTGQKAADQTGRPERGRIGRTVLALCQRPVSTTLTGSRGVRARPVQIGPSLRPYRRGQVRPLKLKALRHQMIGDGQSRTYTNATVRRIRHIFNWAIGEELISGQVGAALAGMKGLSTGNFGVRESPPVKPVAEADVYTIKSHVSRQVWSLIELQLLTDGEAQ